MELGHAFPTLGERGVLFIDEWRVESINKGAIIRYGFCLVKMYLCADREFLAFVDCGRVWRNGRVVEVRRNLFQMPTYFSLAHCVAEDFRMSKGIAVGFRQKFGRVAELKNQREREGGLACLRLDDRFIYYMVTKRRYPLRRNRSRAVPAERRVVRRRAGRRRKRFGLAGSTALPPRPPPPWGAAGGEGRGRISVGYEKSGVVRTRRFREEYGAVSTSAIGGGVLDI